MEASELGKKDLLCGLAYEPEFSIQDYTKSIVSGNNISNSAPLSVRMTTMMNNEPLWGIYCEKNRELSTNPYPSKAGI